MYDEQKIYGKSKAIPINYTKWMNEQFDDRKLLIKYFFQDELYSGLFFVSLTGFVCKLDFLMELYRESLARCMSIK